MTRDANEPHLPGAKSASVADGSARGSKRGDLYRARLASLIHFAGRVPGLRRALRWLAGRYAEGSVVSIKSGFAAGMRWARYHRFVNGYWTGQYELEIQSIIAKNLAPGRVFWDVGANAGFFSLVAARAVGASGEVVALEPLPENAEVLRRQVELNALANCHVVEAAVGAASGEVKFDRTSSTSTGCISDAGDLVVPLTTLDELCARFRAPDLVKVDVEGAEGSVLAGAQALLAATAAPTWLIELHGPAATDAVFKALAPRYTLTQLDGRPARAADCPSHILARPRPAAERA